MFRISPDPSMRVRNVKTAAPPLGISGIKYPGVSKGNGVPMALSGMLLLVYVPPLVMIM